MIFIVNILNKEFVINNNEEIVIPNMLKLGEEKVLPAIKLEKDNKEACLIKLFCKDVFKGEKTFHFKRARRNTLHKKIGKRNLFNLVVCSIV